MKKVLTLLGVMYCLGTTAQTIVYDTTVVRTPLTVAAKNGAGQRDSLYMPPATTAVNGYMTAASMTNIVNLQTDVSTASNNISDLQSAVAALGGTVPSNVQSTTTYTVTSDDNGKMVVMSNASTNTVTLPTGLANGFKCTVLQQGGVIRLAAAGGVTIRSPFNYKRSQTQYGVVTVVCLGNNIYSLSGNLKQ
jgi:hypothetical protein